MGSKKKVTTGWEYFSTFAQLLGMGQVTRLTRITNGEQPIWEGDLDPTSADGDGLTIITTDIGDLRWYWGSATQNIDDLLAAQTADLGAGAVALPFPAFRRLAYFAADDIAHGQQVTPPTLKFDVERRLNLLTLSTHSLDGDCVLPEFLYEIYTNTLWGAGIDPDLIGAASFEAAGEQIILEDLGLSPFIDENLTIREYVGKLLQYIDGYPRWVNGKLELVLIRPGDTVNATVIDESNLADEPRPTNAGWESTWNITHVLFTDRDNDWEENAAETYDDVANRAARGETVSQEIRMPFVTRRSVARMLAKRKGLAGGIPRMSWELRGLPSLRSLRPGDLAFVNYAKKGFVNRLVRVEEVGRDGRDNRTVKLLVTEEITRDETNDFTPPDDDFLGLNPYLGEGGGGAFEIVSLTPRLAVPPPVLLDGALDGMLIAAARSTSMINGMSAWFTHDPVERSFTSIDASAAFPAGAELLWWSPTRDHTAYIARIEFGNRSDAEYATALAQGGEDAWLVACEYHWQTEAGTVDEHQVTTIWLLLKQGGYLVPISDTIVEFEFVGASFNTPDPVAETDTDPGIHPTTIGYIGRRPDLLVHPSNTIAFERDQGNDPEDTDLIRYIRTPAETAGQDEEVADAGEATYDRNDVTMSPEGTLDPTWGTRAPHLPEIADTLLGLRVEGTPDPTDDVLIAELDAALGRQVEATATADDLVLIDETDFVIGARITDGHPTWGRHTP